MRYLLAILALMCLAVGADAQTTTSTSGTIDVAASMSVGITNLAGVMSFDDPADYSNGQTLANAATITVKSNVSWLITIKAQSANWQAMSGTSSTNMPASVLKIKYSSNSSYLTMSTNAQTLKTGSRGGATTSGNTFNTDVNVTPGFSYNNGSYNIGVLFTLTQQ